MEYQVANTGSLWPSTAEADGAVSAAHRSHAWRRTVTWSPVSTAPSNVNSGIGMAGLDAKS